MLLYFRVIVNAHLFVSQTILDITPKCPTIYSMFGKRFVEQESYNLLLAKKKPAEIIFERANTMEYAFTHTFPIWISFLNS